MVEITAYARQIYEKYHPSFSLLEVQHLINYFNKLCEELGVDPYRLDFEQEVTDWHLTYSENLTMIKDAVTQVAAVPREEFDATELLIDEAEKLLKNIGYEAVESKTLDRLRSAEERLKKYMEQERGLKRKLEELRTKYESNLAQVDTKAKEVPTPPPSEGLEAEDVKSLREEFMIYLSRANVTSPEIYEAEFNKTVDWKRSYTENAERLKRLADDIVKRAKRELPKEAAPEIEKRLSRLESSVEAMRERPVEAHGPPRKVTPIRVKDWYDGDEIVIDEDEVWRLRQLLHYKWHFYYLKPENQRKVYGVDTAGGVKLAIFNERITRNHLIDMGLDPKKYGIG